MNKQIAFAYGIAGLAVAAAIVTVVGFNTGLFGETKPPAPESDNSSPATASEDGALMTPAPMTAAESTASESDTQQVPEQPVARRPARRDIPARRDAAAVPAGQRPTEVVYVDQPVGRGGGYGEDEDHDEYEEDDEYEEHEDEDEWEEDDD